MKLRYISVLVILLLGGLIFIQPAMAGWSVADPNDPANKELIDRTAAQGYWNFPYDPAHPMTAAMYCCWWEQWYHVSKPYYDAVKANNASGSSIVTNSYPSQKISNTTGTDNSSIPKVVPKAYCPCLADDAAPNPDFDAKSAVLLATKPWLKEGKTSSTTSTSTTSQTKQDSSGQTTVMKFSDPK